MQTHVAPLSADRIACSCTPLKCVCPVEHLLFSHCGRDMCAHARRPVVQADPLQAVHHCSGTRNLPNLPCSTSRTVVCNLAQGSAMSTATLLLELVDYNESVWHLDMSQLCFTKHISQAEQAYADVIWW